MCIETAPVIVMLDKARMKQVFVNLIDNAIKYTPMGDSVKLSAFLLGQIAVIEMYDTGIGIPLEALPHVFDRFFRADRAHSRVSGGAGLGLSIVKAICNANGGSIAGRSLEGKETVIKSELPMAVTLASSARALR